MASEICQKLKIFGEKCWRVDFIAILFNTIQLK